MSGLGIEESEDTILEEIGEIGEIGETPYQKPPIKNPTGGGGLRCGMGCRILRGAAGGARGPPSAHENRRLQIYSKT